MHLFRRSARLDRQQVQLYTAVVRVPLHGRRPGHGFQVIRQCRLQVVILARQFGPPGIQSPALHLGPGTPLPEPPHPVGILRPKVHGGNKGQPALSACGRDRNRHFFAPKAFRFLLSFFFIFFYYDFNALPISPAARWALDQESSTFLLFYLAARL